MSLRKRRKFNIPILMTTGVLGGGGVSVLPFDEQVLALPGLHTYYKFDETSGTTAVNSAAPGTRDATYVGLIPLNQVAFPAGGAAPNYVDTNDDISAYSASLASVWSFQTGWLMIWFKQDAAGLGKLVLRADGATTDADVLAHNGATQGYGRITSPFVNGNYYQRHNDWTFKAMTWQTGGQYRQYLQGARLYSTSYTQASPIALNNLQLGRISGFKGAIAHVAFGAGSIPTDAQIDALYKAAYTDTHKTLFVVGDSWATDNDYWIDTLVADLRGTGNSFAWREGNYRLGYSGSRMAAIASGVATALPNYSAAAPDAIVIAGGTNDLVAPATDEATYKAAVTSLYNTLSTKYPGVPIFIQNPGRADADYSTEEAAIATWNATLVTLHANLYAGVDNVTTFKANAATWSTDNLHPDTDTGRLGVAAAWATVLGNAGLT